MTIPDGLIPINHISHPVCSNFEKELRLYIESHTSSKLTFHVDPLDVRHLNRIKNLMFLTLSRGPQLGLREVLTVLNVLYCYTISASEADIKDYTKEDLK